MVYFQKVSPSPSRFFQMHTHHSKERGALAARCILQAESVNLVPTPTTPRPYSPMTYVHPSRPIQTS